MISDEEDKRLRELIDGFNTSVSLVYDLGCRSCLNFRQNIVMTFTHIDDIPKFKKQTEYFHAVEIEKTERELGHRCRMCGSENVEVLNVKLDGEPCYDYDKLSARAQIKKEFMLQFNIQSSNNIIVTTNGGSNFAPSQFYQTGFTKIINELKSKGQETFTPLSRAHFFVCITGIYNSLLNDYSIEIQSLQYAGLSLETIINSLQREILKMNVGVKL